MFKSDTLFARFMNMLCDILLIGILWVICCIPVFTVVTSTTSAYYAMSKVVVHKTGYVSREFFHAFMVNFRQTWMTGLLFVGITAVLLLDAWYLWNNTSSLNDSLFVVVVGIAFIHACVSAFYCPLLSRFTKTNLQMLKLSFIIGFRYLYFSIPVIAVFLVMLVGIWLMPWAILVFPGIFQFLMTIPGERILKKLMPVPEEGSPEADMWYYV